MCNLLSYVQCDARSVFIVSTGNPRYNDRICSQRCCHYNEFAVVKNPSLEKMICKKAIVLFLFPHRTYVFGYLLESPTLVSIALAIYQLFILCSSIFLHDL